MRQDDCGFGMSLVKGHSDTQSEWINRIVERCSMCNGSWVMDSP